MSPESSSKNWLIIVGALAVVLLGSFILLRGMGSDTPTATTTGTTTVSSSTSFVVNTPTGSYTIEQVPISDSPAPPQIHRPLTFSADVPADTQAAIQASATALEEKLLKDKYNGQLWLNLGTVRKIAGDYEGARQAWEYVAVLFPKNSTPLYNLADLYGGFLKQYAVAESYYKKVIALDPHDTNVYRNLYELYTSVYKVGTTAAENILKQGITANPNAIDLHVLLARHYKTQGRTADAKAQYDAAIASAKSQGQNDIVAQIEQEKASL